MTTEQACMEAARRSNNGDGYASKHCRYWDICGKKEKSNFFTVIIDEQHFQGGSFDQCFDRYEERLEVGE